MSNQAIEALQRAIRSRWLSIDFDHNRTPEALSVRQQIIAALDQAEKASAARVYVTMEGGICQGVSTNDPALVGASYTVIDYDVEGATDSEITLVQQDTGDDAEALISGGAIDAISVTIREDA